MEEQVRKPQVTVGEDVAQTTKLKYLGTITQSNGETHEDVMDHIQVGWHI